MNSPCRSRSASDSKRTRGIRSPEEQELDKEIFAPSKRVLRSPRYINKETENPPEMNELKDMMKEMMSELKRNTDELRKIRDEMKKKEEEWAVEKEELKGRLSTLERKLDLQDKNKRKNNTILTGIEIEGDNLDKSIEMIIKKELDIVASIKKSYRLVNQKNIPMYMIEWSTWNDKMKVMRNKHKLKENSRKIYIENDLTPDERKIQLELRHIARQEKAKNKRVKVGYQKICIEGVEFKWNVEENRLVELGRQNIYPKN